MSAQKKPSRTPRPETKAPSNAKAKLAAVSKDLRQIATKVNAEMRKVAKRLASADDARLEAAVGMAIAEESCRSAGVPFAKWADANLKVGRETWKRLIPIGRAERKTKGSGAAMLAEMRERNRIANAEMRARKRDSAGADDSDSAGERDDSPEAKAARRRNAIMAIFNAIEDENEKRAIVEEMASACGAKVTNAPKRRRAA